MNAAWREGLNKAAAARRHNMGLRIGVTAMIALALSLSAKINAGWLWAGAYAAAQLIELRLTAPVARGQDLSRVRQVGLVVIACIASAVFAVISLPLYASTLRFSSTVATLLLSGAVLNVLALNSASRLMLLAAGGPPFACLFLGPLLAQVAKPDQPLGPVLWIGSMALVGACVTAYLRLDSAMRAETTAKAEAERRRAEAEVAHLARTEFVNVVSHELRTPISAILAGAAELERLSGEPAAKRSAQLISGAGLMMRDLLTNMLDLARLEASRMTPYHDAFDLRDALAQTVRLWRAPAREKGLRLRFEGAAVVPQWVRGDVCRLRQVLGNLLSNAIKFTASGAVTVRIEAAPAPQGVRVSISVIDTGAGLNADQIDRLFTPFDQLQAGGPRAAGGSGLGLAVSRELTRLMGGSLKCESGPGAGCAFTLALDLPFADAPAKPAVGRSGGPARVLIVDDHSVNRTAAALILQPLGLEITVAGSAEEALERLARSAFDLVLMDVYMPGADGREATRRLRGGGGVNAQAPVIAITASDTPADRQSCLEAGMNAVLAKPFDAPALQAAVIAALSDVRAAPAALIRVA